MQSSFIVRRGLIFPATEGCMRKAIPKCELGSHINVLVCKLEQKFESFWKLLIFFFFFYKNIFPHYMGEIRTFYTPDETSPRARYRRKAAPGPGSRRSIGGKFLFHFHKYIAQPACPPPPPTIIQSFQKNV